MSRRKQGILTSDPEPETTATAPVEPKKSLEEQIVGVMGSLGREPTLERLYEALRKEGNLTGSYFDVKDEVRTLIVAGKLVLGTRGGIRLPENRRSLIVALDLQRKTHGRTG